MAFYFIIGFIITIPAFLELNTFTSKRQNGLMFYLSCVLLFALSCIRWETGTDWKEYYYYFNTIDSSFNTYGVEDFEIGIRAINVIVRRLGGNFVALNCIYALIVLFAQKFWINDINNIICENERWSTSKKKYRNLIVFCLWFLYFGNIFTTRSTIAFSIVLCALPFAIKKRPISFFMITMLTTILVHRSCILFVVVYFLINIDIKWFSKMYSFFWIWAIVAAIGIKSILSILIRFFPATYSYRMSYYMGISGERSWFGLLNYILLIVFFLWGLKRYYYTDNSLYIKLLNIFTIGFIPYLVGFITSEYFIRASWPFMMMTLVLIPMILQRMSKNNKLVFFMIFIFYFSLRMWSNLNSYPEAYIPFNTIF